MHGVGSRERAVDGSHLPTWHRDDADCPATRYGTVSAAFRDERRSAPWCSSEEEIMLYYALAFLVVALVAGALGVSGVAAVSTNIAYVLFVIAIVLFLVHMLSGRRTLAP
jgi:uncharacterized membrane protein YtjA (UPF0391 family)